MTSKNKVAIIGWDSASFDIIDPLLRDSHLPNLQQLIQRGLGGPLHSTIQPITPTAWTSFTTGVNPGKHGVFDFVRLDPLGRFEVSSGASVNFPPLWRFLGRQGKRVLVVNVPMTYPPESVNGVMVAGMDSPDQARVYAFPSEVKTYIEQRYPTYRVGVKTSASKSVEPENYVENYVEELIEMTAMRADLSVDLLQQTHPDFFMSVFIAPDRVQHALGHLMTAPITADDGIGRVYKACDAALGKILQQLDENWTVFLVSDHGACAYQRVFELSTWLQRQGWLHLEALSWYGPTVEFMRKVKRHAQRKLGLPVFQRSGLQQFKKRVSWDQTRAFALGAFGNIYINRRGRFPWGIVTEEEYDQLCAEIEKQLLALKDDETGQRVVKRVYRAAEVYSGPYSHLAPDLLVETEADYFVRNNLDQEEGSEFYDAGIYQGRQLAHTGRHTLNGLFVAAGPHVRVDKSRIKADIVDVAPTVLYLLDTAVPAIMDGQLRLDWFTDAYRSAHPAIYDDKLIDRDDRSAPAYTEEEADQVTDHLRALGYLD